MPKIPKANKVKTTVVMSQRSMDFVNGLATTSGESRSAVINEILEMVADSGILDVMKDLKAQEEARAREGLRAMTASLTKDLDGLKKEI